MISSKAGAESSTIMTRADRLARVQFFGAGVLLIAILYWGSEILVPCALALLISFLLFPIVRRLRDWHIPNAIAVTLVTVAASTLVVALIALFSAQVLDLLYHLPDYRQNLTDKFESLRSTTGEPLSQVSKAIDEIQTQIAATQTSDALDQAPPPIKATIVEKEPTFFETAGEVVKPILGPLAVAGTVFVLVFFFLLESDVAQIRLRYLIRRLRLGITDEVVDDTAIRLGVYLRMQLIVNVSYGLMVTLAMWAFGVPNYALWGMSAAMLRYVPYLGPLLAAALPILLSVAYFPGWGKPLWITGCFIVSETITNGILEPVLYGNRTGVSSLGVVISAFFWYWLWGPVGIILAMPMTICLVVVGKQIPMLAPLAYLLSGDAKSRRRFQESTEEPEPTLFDPPPAQPAPDATPAAPAAGPTGAS